MEKTENEVKPGPVLLCHLSPETSCHFFSPSWVVRASAVLGKEMCTYRCFLDFIKTSLECVSAEANN